MAEVCLGMDERPRAALLTTDCPFSAAGDSLLKTTFSTVHEEDAKPWGTPCYRVRSVENLMTS